MFLLFTAKSIAQNGAYVINSQENTSLVFVFDRGEVNGSKEGLKREREREREREKKKGKKERKKKRKKKKERRRAQNAYGQRSR